MQQPQKQQQKVEQFASVVNSRGQKFEAPFPGPLTQEALQSVLDANQELIRLCVDLQNDSSPSARQELQLVHARLQRNLNFLAAVADNPKSIPS